MSNDTKLITVPFYDHDLFLLQHECEVYVPLKPIVESLGLSWSTQYHKLMRATKFSCVHMNTTASDGKTYDYLCIPLKKLNGWLFSINPEKVREDLKQKLIAYQDECFIALHDYWTKGVATNEKFKELPQARITAILKAAINEIDDTKVMVNYTDMLQYTELATSIAEEKKNLQDLEKKLQETRERMEIDSGRKLGY